MKRTASIHLFLCASLSLLVFACKKGINDTQADPLLSEGKQRGSLTSLTTQPVYIGGSENGQAKYWVDNGGTITGVTLPDGGGVSGIVATGGHVYTCGSGTNPATSLSSAVYWVDGVIHYLPYVDPFGGSSQLTFATGIAVVGGHIYVTGRVGAFTNRAAYWVDGVQVNLGFGEPNGMFADGTNIYIPNGDTPSYWKIDVSDPANPVTTMVPLPLLMGHTNDVAVAITASGGNVYVAGWYGGSTERALLWTDNISQPRALGSTNSRAYAVAVGANGPVVAGIQGADFNNQPIGYWAFPLNNDPITILSSGEQLGSMMGITTDPATGETFVCGTEGGVGAKYWTISSTGGTISHTLSSSSGGIANCIALGQ